MTSAQRAALAKKLEAHAALVAAVLRREDVSRSQIRTLTAVGTARILSSLADEALLRLVELARSEGFTWEQIGDVVGTTRQAAFQRFGKDAARG